MSQYSLLLNIHVRVVSVDITFLIAHRDRLVIINIIFAMIILLQLICNNLD